MNVDVKTGRDFPDAGLPAPERNGSQNENYYRTA
jgi:hypothetical protein